LTKIVTTAILDFVSDQNILKLLKAGESATARVYLNYLKRIEAGEILSAKEREDLAMLKEELEAKTADPPSILSSNLILASEEVAAFFGITRQAVQHWLKLGCPKLGRSQWDLKAVFDWWRENIADTSSDDSINAAKREYWIAKAERERIMVDQMKGKLVSWKEVIQSWTWRLIEVKNGLLLLSDRLAGLLEGKSRKEIHHIIKREVYHMLESYSRGGKFCPAPTQQKQEAHGVKKNEEASNHRKS